MKLKYFVVVWGGEGKYFKIRVGALTEFKIPLVPRKKMKEGSNHPSERILRINTHTTSLIPPWEDQCEWHRMTRMTGPECAVMCTSINTYTHTHSIIDPPLGGSTRVA